MNLKSEIIRFSKEIGIDKVGFASADPFLKEKEILQERKRKQLISPFEEQDMEARCNPQRLLDGAKTIICFAIGYLIEPSVKKEFSSVDIPEGKISKYAQIKDYHNILNEKLIRIADFISEKEPGKFKIMVDTGALIERAAAARAGIGWIGENTCLFTHEFGSWVFLGEILTDIEIESDDPAETYCDKCGRCIAACPTGALIEPFKLNPHKCLSYITQMRGQIPKEFRETLGNMIFGCDICQDVCPYNKDVNIPNHQEFFPDVSLEKNLEKLAILSKQDFNRMFKPAAAGWRGRNIIRRNAICALGNIRYKGAIKTLEYLTTDPSEIIREQVSWSLRQIIQSV